MKNMFRILWGFLSLPVSYILAVVILILDLMGRKEAVSVLVKWLKVDEREFSLIMNGRRLV